MSQGGEKTEQPTAKRLRDARRKGQVAKSQDLSSALLLSAAIAVLWLAGGYMSGWLIGAARDQLQQAGSFQGNLYQATALAALFSGIKSMALVLSPLFAVLIVFAVLANYFQIGSVFTFETVNELLAMQDYTFSQMGTFSQG